MEGTPPPRQRDGWISRGANLPRVADYNERVVLDAIRRSGTGLSRVEMTTRLGLVAQTISNVVSRLSDRGLLLEVGKVHGLGKPRTLLGLKPDAFYAVGVHVDPAIITCVLTDFTGKVISRSTLPTPRAQHPEEVLVEISTMVGETLKEAGVPREKILGIGLASPGPIDAVNGLVLDPPLLPDWQQVPLRDHLATITMLPVLLEKDVFACAVAEWWSSPSDVSENFAFFYFGSGLGVGLVLGGVPFRGASSNAGDIGGMPTREHYPSTDVGDDDSALGVVASIGYMVRHPLALELLGEAPRLDDPLALEAAFRLLCRAAEEGNANAIAVLEMASRAFASAVVATVNMLDMDTVVFGGPLWDVVGERFMAQARRDLAALAVSKKVHPIELRSSPHGPDVAAVGAASLVLDYMFSPRPSVVMIENGNH